jgi:acetylornithine aminotransferase
LIEAVTSQVKKVHHTSNLYYIPQQGELAQMLTDRSPTDRVFFCNSGAEANEAAIKLARKHARTKLGITDPYIISAKSSFHGRTLATLAATGQFKYQEPFLPMPVRTRRKRARGQAA